MLGQLKQHRLRKNVNNFLLQILLLTTALLSGCSVSNQANIVWQSKTQVLQQAQKIQVGDILITPKDWKDPLSWWGHSALIINAQKEVGEFPKLGYGYFQTPLSIWLKHRSQMSILRYQNITPEFKDRLIKNNLDLIERDYGILSTKADLLNHKNTSLYCSSYIWYLYQKTANDFNHQLDIDGDEGYWVMPYDFLSSPKLFQIKL